MLSFSASRFISAQSFSSAIFLEILAAAAGEVILHFLI